MNQPDPSPDTGLGKKAHLNALTAMVEEYRMALEALCDAADWPPSLIDHEELGRAVSLADRLLGEDIPRWAGYAS